ncbi:MAG: topology modulation protein [Clostridia bacterium]|jgi:dephospho-CoA kinase|nr:topology modulation protein [Clostridia bacterium]
MNKILIIGIVASGKTTLAKKLSKKINVPWYELDSIVHHQTEAGRFKRTADEQIEMMYKWTLDFESNRDRFEAKLQLYQHKIIRLYDNKNLNMSCRKSFATRKSS